MLVQDKWGKPFFQRWICASWTNEISTKSSACLASVSTPGHHVNSLPIPRQLHWRRKDTTLWTMIQRRRRQPTACLSWIQYSYECPAVQTFWTDLWYIVKKLPRTLAGTVRQRKTVITRDDEQPWVWVSLWCRASVTPAWHTTYQQRPLHHHHLHHTHHKHSHQHSSWINITCT